MKGAGVWLSTSKLTAPQRHDPFSRTGMEDRSVDVEVAGYGAGRDNRQ